MSVTDDEKFKSYLKKFRPVAPEPLRAKRHPAGARVAFALAGAAACTAVVVLGLLLPLHHEKSNHSTNRGGSSTDATQLSTSPAPRPMVSTPKLRINSPVLTKLAFDDSAAFDALVADESRTELPRMQSEQSALRVLAKD